MPRKASSAARRSRGGAPGFVTRATFGLSSSRTAAPLATGVAMRSLGVCAPAFLGALVLAGSPLSAEIRLMFRFQRGYSTERAMRPFLTLGPYVGVRIGCRRDLVEGDSTMRHTDCSNNPTDILVGNQPLISAAYQSVDLGGVAS